MTLETKNSERYRIKTRNIFPDDHKYLTFLKKVFRHEFRKNGFRRISTPFFDEKNFFQKVFWEDLKDSLIDFKVWDLDSFCLNPSPSILNFKAYLKEEKDYDIQPVYNYFMWTYFPKIWDFCTEWKILFGWDVIWENDVIIDVVNLYIVSNILDKIWFKWEYKIKINFIWNKKEILKYSEALEEFYSDKKHILTEKWLDFLEGWDVLKIFSSDNEDEQILFKSSPKIDKFYKKDSKSDVLRLKKYLEILNLDYVWDSYLFWEYDFNDWVIWEIKLIENWDQTQNSFQEDLTPNPFQGDSTPNPSLHGPHPQPLSSKERGVGQRLFNSSLPQTHSNFIQPKLSSSSFQENLTPSPSPLEDRVVGQGESLFENWVEEEDSYIDKNILARGYWYNELSILLGESKEIAWSWFWVDILKLINSLKSKNICIKNKDKLDLFFVQLGDDAKKVVMPLSLKARNAGINTAVSLGTPSIKDQMLKAQRSWATYVVIVWVMEAKSWVFQVRNNISGVQEEVKKDELIDYIIDKIGSEALDFYDPSRDLLEE